MCGIFGIVSKSKIDRSQLMVLASHAQQRGKDSSGLMFAQNSDYQVHRADYKIKRLLKETSYGDSSVVFGHSRLITNGLSDNQPVIRDDVCVFHNGIVVNHEAIWSDLQFERRLHIDTEVIACLADQCLNVLLSLERIPTHILSLCRGIVACAIVLPRIGKLCLFSNNGSLYLGRKGEAWLYASEKFPLLELDCQDLHQVRDAEFIDIPISNVPISVLERSTKRADLIPMLGTSSPDERLLEYRSHNLRRCTRCILPETMPFISFNASGVCNYCTHYKLRNKPRPISELLSLVESYRRSTGDDCIVPFSGGRDSCYGLHLIVKDGLINQPADPNSSLLVA